MGIKIYLRHWKTLSACVLFVVLPVEIVSVLLTASIAPEMLDFTAQETGVSEEEVDAFIVAQLVIGALQGLVFLLVTAACFKAVADAYLGARPAAGRSLSFALRRLPMLVLLGIVGTIGLALALIALIVPGIWLAVAWSLAIPALLFERVGAFAALGRSFRLVKGRWWNIAGTLLIGVFLVSFVGGLINGLLLAVPTLLAGDNDFVLALSTVVANTAGSVLTTPFTAAVIALVYFDQRVRKEGFDLQLLAEGIGGERDPDAPLPAPMVEPEPYTAEERAQAPYWPPPPGWKPEPRAPAPAEPWSAPDSVPPPSTPARPAAEPPAPEPPAPEPPASEPPPPAEPEPAPSEGGGWSPPEAPQWPPPQRERGPGGL